MLTRPEIICRLTLMTACIICGTVLGAVAHCSAAGRLFFIVAKSESDLNFMRVYEAAKSEAVAKGDRVVLTGGKGKAHFRIQDESIREAMRQEPDGLAVSVLHSRFLAENSFKLVHAAGIPVLTYDSDFTEPYHSLRAGYVGTDNVELGRELARQAQKLRPGGGMVAIQTGGLDDTNLIARIQGVREQLALGVSGSEWTLDPRSPIPCRDNYNQALGQLENLLEDPEVHVIISVGWWAEMSEGYAPLVERFRRSLGRGEKILIFAGAHPRQREIFAKRLSHVNIGLDFEEMGRLVYRNLSRLADGGSVPEVTHTPMDILSQDCLYAPAR